MKLINILYEDDYDHAVIASVPNWVADDIENVVMTFFSWLNIGDNGNDYLVEENGITGMVIGAKEFVDWLNNIFQKPTDTPSKIICEDTVYDPTLPTAEF